VSELIGIDHFSLSVRNLDHSEQWYRDVLGMHRVHTERGAHSDAVVLVHDGSGMVLCLRQHHGTGTARFDESRTGLDHISFGVADRDDLDRWERILDEHHVEHSPVSDTPFGAVMVFRDPDHIQLELAWRGAVTPTGSGDRP
jgi:catechol 2,3-dioxygenase-like lactoylglutathione lyase family enzyme